MDSFAYFPPASALRALFAEVEGSTWEGAKRLVHSLGQQGFSAADWSRMSYTHPSGPAVEGHMLELKEQGRKAAVFGCRQQEADRDRVQTAKFVWVACTSDDPKVISAQLQRQIGQMCDVYGPPAASVVEAGVPTLQEAGASGEPPVLASICWGRGPGPQVSVPQEWTGLKKNYDAFVRAVAQVNNPLVATFIVTAENGGYAMSGAIAP